MKILNKIIAMVGVCFLLTNCASDLDIKKLDDESQFVAPVMLTPSDITITEENIAQDTPVSITWSAAEYGQPTAVVYTICASYNGKESTMYSNITTESYDAKSSELSEKLLNLGIPLGEKVSVNFSLKATIGSNFTELESADKSVKVLIIE